MRLIGVIMNISITTDFIKLDQLLKFSGIAENGADAKFMILNGEIEVNGETELKRGKKIKKGDIVKAGEQIINVC